ncbi:MAG: hypothetical protein IID44_18450, partial [Planctomycetes bacterium]|nr:hypothetical protein [Planctomycetota bacterium]
MNTTPRTLIVAGLACVLTATAVFARAEEKPAAENVVTKPAALPKAVIDGTGPGWKVLGEADFVNVNCA